jgi:hypothetical protein
MEITITIKPSATLPSARFLQINEKAKRLNISPEQVVINAIIAGLSDAETEATA